MAESPHIPVNCSLERCFSSSRHIYASAKRLSFVQIMACRLFGAKPSSAPMNFINWTLASKFQSYWNHNTEMLIQGNTFEKVVCDKAAILSGSQYVDTISASLQIAFGRVMYARGWQTAVVTGIHFKRRDQWIPMKNSQRPSWVRLPDICFLHIPAASFTKKVNTRLAKRPLKTNGRLANLVLASLVKEATGVFTRY